MTSSIQAIRGMNDILPPESARWEWFEDTMRALMRRYGYQNVRTPIVEPTSALFVRGLGEVTDIVEKEMYPSRPGPAGKPCSLPIAIAAGRRSAGPCRRRAPIPGRSFPR